MRTSDSPGGGPARKPAGGRRRTAFWLGLLCGFTAAAALICGAALGAAAYLGGQAADSAAFAAAAPLTAADNQVELYFPLERFLAWRSTPKLQLDMVKNRVHAHMEVVLLPALRLRVGLDLFGEPGVAGDYFALTHVVGFVDHIPVPRDLLLGAIAVAGARYGVHVNSARDSLLIERNTGAYHLVGYDKGTRDLIISLPASAILRAAGGRTPL